MAPNNTRNQHAESLFRERYGKSPNIMTPRIWARRLLAAGHLAVEMSHGDGFRAGTDIWGVTVLNAHNVHDPVGHDLSRSFDNRADAESYIETLRAWRPAS